jgi:hypothetical protein
MLTYTYTDTMLENVDNVDIRHLTVLQYFRDHHT